VKGLESAFHVQRTKISLAEMWKHDRPDGPENNDFAEYLYRVCLLLAVEGNDSIDTSQAGGYPYYRDSYIALAPYRDEYTEKFGKFPFVQRAMHWQWYLQSNTKASLFAMLIISCRDVAITITLEERDKYWRRSEIYRKWLLNRVFEANSSTVSIMIFPIQSGQVEYREADIPCATLHAVYVQRANTRQTLLHPSRLFLSEYGSYDARSRNNCAW
jgi:hypothetical protein